MHQQDIHNYKTLYEGDSSFNVPGRDAQDLENSNYTTFDAQELLKKKLFREEIGEPWPYSSHKQKLAPDEVARSVPIFPFFFLIVLGTLEILS
jgi:hypothetical protein